MKKITGLYLSKSKKGETFMSGKTQEGVKYFVFKNNKTKDNHPDYNLYVEDDAPVEPKPKPESKQSKFEIDDDIPF
jgi:hypothetical protein